MATNKIDRINAEIEKTREKISEQQAHLKELLSQKTELEAHTRGLPPIGTGRTSRRNRNGRRRFTPPGRSLYHHFFKRTVSKKGHTSSPSVSPPPVSSVSSSSSSS